MFCNECGKENKDGANYCAACGADLKEQEIIKEPVLKTVSNSQKPEEDKNSTDNLSSQSEQRQLNVSAMKETIVLNQKQEESKLDLGANNSFNDSDTLIQEAANEESNKKTKKKKIAIASMVGVAITLIAIVAVILIVNSNKDPIVATWIHNENVLTVKNNGTFSFEMELEGYYGVFEGYWEYLSDNDCYYFICSKQQFDGKELKETAFGGEFQTKKKDVLKIVMAVSGEKGFTLGNYTKK